MAGGEEVEELITAIRIDAGLPDKDYLEAQTDYEGIKALAVQLNRQTDKNVS